jgi:hypothetical protein
MKKKKVETNVLGLTQDTTIGILKSIVISAFAVFSALAIILAIRVALPETNIDALIAVVMTGTLALFGGIFNKILSQYGK